MAVLALVLLFVLLALGAFFLAMSGGPSGARQKVQTQSRRGRKGALGLFVLALVVLGVAVPAYVIAQDKDRTAIPEANVTELTALQEHGRDLFGQRCRNCHTLKAANATASVGPDLDASPRSEALVLDAIAKGRANCNGNMPAQVFEGEDAIAVAQFVAVATGGELTPERRARGGVRGRRGHPHPGGRLRHAGRGRALLGPGGRRRLLERRLRHRLSHRAACSPRPFIPLVPDVRRCPVFGSAGAFATMSGGRLGSRSECRRSL